MENPMATLSVVHLVILGIVLLNVLVIYKVVSRSRRCAHLVGRTKNLALILLVLGDVCVALFSMPVEMVQDPSSVPCWMRIAAHIYLFHVIPFLHAAGLVTLIAESYCFWRRYCKVGFKFQKGMCSVKSLGIGFLPWVLGFTFILPLVLVGFDYDICSANYGLARIASFYYCSIIVPAIVVFCLASIYLMSFKGPHHHTYFPGDIAPLEQSKAAFVDNDDDDDVRNILLEDESFSEELLTPDAARSREKRCLLVASLVFCFFSLPMAVLSLIVIRDEELSEQLISTEMISRLETLYRLHVLRSLISPLVWIHEYN